MRRYLLIFYLVIGLVGLALSPAAATAAVPSIGEIVEDFRLVFGKTPTHEEQEYWKARRADTPEQAKLRSLMEEAKVGGETTGDPIVKTPRDLFAAVPRAFRKVFGREPKEKEKQYWADRALCEDLTNYEALVKSLAFHQSKGVSIGKGTKAEFCARARARQAGPAGIPLRAALGFGGSPSGPLVRIGLLEVKQSGVKISGAGKFFLRLAGGQKKFFAGPKDALTVSWSGRAYRVRGPKKFALDQENPPRFGGTEAQPLILLSQTAKADGVPGPGPFNRYRGTIEVRVSGKQDSLWAVNELSVEAYLRGLAETTNDSPPEYQKALATAARTYALYHLARGGRRTDDLFTIGKTANDQLYAGYDYERRVPNFVAQVKSTRGVLVTHQDSPIASLYFSQSDGRTRDGEVVWKTERFPYLKAKADPHGGKVLIGHGTGMSARGAVGFALKDGWNFRKILTYYYTGVKLARAY